MSASQDFLIVDPAEMPVDIECVPDFAGDGPINQEPLPNGLDPVHHALVDQLMASEQIGEGGIAAQKYIRNVRLQRDFGAYMIGTVERAIATCMAEVAEAAAAVTEANTAVAEATTRLIEVTRAIRHATVALTEATARLTEAITTIVQATGALDAATAASTRANAELTEGLATLEWMRKGMGVQDGEYKTESNEFIVFDVLHG